MDKQCLNCYKNELARANESHTIDKIASFLEKEENWRALKSCWLVNGRSEDLRSLLRRAIDEEKNMSKCDCYRLEYGKSVCLGTKEREPCSCNGDTTKCDFYPNKRVVIKE